MLKEIPVFILCGGLGTRLKEETEFRPKPMVPIGDKPILWHIMRWYSKFGFRRFILCTGFKSEVIKEYFLNYTSLNSDFTIDLASNQLNVHSIDHNEDWEVTVAYTGEHAMTGARIARAAERYLGDASTAAVTYGDGLTDVDLAKELEFHLDQKALGTILGVNPPSRFGELQTEGDRVLTFAEKPQFEEKWINGGFFFFQRSFFRNYLETEDACILERTPLARLAADGELRLFRHNGFWACMDTQRDRDHLNQLWAEGRAPWAIPSLQPEYLPSRDLVLST